MANLIVFLFSLAFCAYTLFGYPLLPGLLARWRTRPARKAAIRSYRETTNPAKADPGSNSQADASILAAPDASPLAMAPSTSSRNSPVSMHLDYGKLLRYRISNG